MRRDPPGGEIRGSRDGIVRQWAPEGKGLADAGVSINRIKMAVYVSMPRKQRNHRVHPRPGDDTVAAALLAWTRKGIG